MKYRDPVEVRPYRESPLEAAWSEFCEKVAINERRKSQGLPAIYLPVEHMRKLKIDSLDSPAQ